MLSAVAASTAVSSVAATAPRPDLDARPGSGWKPKPWSGPGPGSGSGSGSTPVGLPSSASSSASSSAVSSLSSSLFSNYSSGTSTTQFGSAQRHLRQAPCPASGCSSPISATPTLLSVPESSKLGDGPVPKPVVPAARQPPSVSLPKVAHSSRSLRTAARLTDPSRSLRPVGRPRKARSLVSRASLPAQHLTPEARWTIFPRDPHAPPRYKYIARNEYRCAKLDADSIICDCNPPLRGDGHCGDRCINRLTDTICDPASCPNGARCTNGPLPTRPIPRCEVRFVGDRGFGLFTLEPIRKGQLIDEYRGQVINEIELRRRMTRIYSHTSNFYAVSYDPSGGQYLDSALSGNRTRFANHSCAPNGFLQKFLLCGSEQPREGEYELGFLASRDIEVGEELTYDYGKYHSHAPCYAPCRARLYSTTPYYSVVRGHRICLAYISSVTIKISAPTYYTNKDGKALALSRSQHGVCAEPLNARESWMHGKRSSSLLPPIK